MSTCPGHAARHVEAGEAERERRAKVINAEGEFQAAAKLAEAAEVLARFPSRSSSATCRPCVRSPRSGTHDFFPLPLDLFAPLLRAFSARSRQELNWRNTHSALRHRRRIWNP